MDDDFWLKIERDDEDIEFMDSMRHYNNVRRKSKPANQNSQTEPPVKIVPKLCNVQNDYSLFNQTKIGKVLYSLLIILPFFIHASFILTVIFAIRQMVITFIFSILCVGIIACFLIIAKVREELNIKFKNSLKKINGNNKKNTSDKCSQNEKNK
jgi:hypothetical protein